MNIYREHKIHSIHERIIYTDFIELAKKRRLTVREKYNYGNEREIWIEDEEGNNITQLGTPYNRDVYSVRSAIIEIKHYFSLKEMETMEDFNVWLDKNKVVEEKKE